VTYTLGNNQENLTLTGANLISGYGNELANIIIGNKVSNLLEGGLGKDTLKGGDGNDEYHVNLIKYGIVARLEDTVIENKNEGVNDKLILFGEIVLLNATTLTLGSNLESLSAENTANTKLNLTGNALNNELIGNNADNFLNGGLGADAFHGGNGNDIYLVDNIGDTVFENLNAGTDLVKVNIAVANGTYQVTENVENATLLSTVAYSFIGNGLDNILIGNGANNSLTGANGNDTLEGGAGADSLMGGRGADLLIGGIGKDNYILAESTPATDTVRVAAGDSLVAGFDLINGFKLGNSQGDDQLDLASTLIAVNTTVNGADKGVIHSHQITDGMITFDDVNSYSDALDITSSNFANVLSYLQANIKGSSTVGFISEGNTYVFQDGGDKDTLVELVGVTANSLNSTDLAADTLWIV
jgi:Ca2+-binding RTX toxin-like protein